MCSLASQMDCRIYTDYTICMYLYLQDGAICSILSRAHTKQEAIKVTYTIDAFRSYFIFHS